MGDKQDLEHQCNQMRPNLLQTFCEGEPKGQNHLLPLVFNQKVSYCVNVILSDSKTRSHSSFEFILSNCFHCFCYKKKRKGAVLCWDLMCTIKWYFYVLRCTVLCLNHATCKDSYHNNSYHKYSRNLAEAVNVYKLSERVCRRKSFAYLSEPLLQLQTYNCKQYCNQYNTSKIFQVNKDVILHFLHKFC